MVLCPQCDAGASPHLSGEAYGSSAGRLAAVPSSGEDGRGPSALGGDRGLVSTRTDQAGHRAYFHPSPSPSPKGEDAPSVVVLGVHGPDDGVSQPPVGVTASGADVSAIGVDYPGEGVGLAPFSAAHPPSPGHPLTGTRSEAPALPSRVEWELIGVPPAGILDAPALGLAPAPAVIPALALPVAAAGGGSRRH